MSALFKKAAKLALLAIISTSFFAVSGISPAQAATTVYVNDTDAPLAFVRTTAQVIRGSGGTSVNDIVLYKNVGTYGGVSIDAAVTVLSISGSITNFDNPGSATTATGYLNNFMMNTSGGEARLRFEFFKAGSYTGPSTGIPVVLQNVKITSIDLDCSSASGSYQYTDATGFQKYSMMSPTNLAVQSMASPNRVRFIANKTGSRSSVPEDQVMLKYDAIQTVEFSFGNVVAGSTNYFGLVFGGWPNGGAPVEYTNVFNTPPTSNSTTMNAYGATILSINNFGNYADVDNNPFFSVVINSVSSGTLEYYNGSSWATVSAGQAIKVADIELGYLRYTPGTGTPTISFNVNDGLDNSTSAYTITVTIASQTQTITFNNPGTKGSGSGAFASGATASSGLTVTLVSLTPGICTIDGTDPLKIVPVAAGTCVIVASQSGNGTYGAAPDVRQEFQIVDGTAPTTPQTITFTSPDSMTVGASGYTQNATASSGLTVTLVSLTPSICTVDGSTPPKIVPVSAGSCKVEATQAGNSTYLPATKVILTIPVNAVAGGGTAPGVRTTGPKFTATDAVTLTGRLDTNGVDTIWYFCYKSTDRLSVSNGEIQSATCTPSSPSTLTNNGTQNREVTANLSSLSQATYYYQLVGWHSGNGKVFGGIWKFKPKNYPYIRTTDASSIGQTTATLNGSVQTKSDKEHSITICYSDKFSVATDYSGKLLSCIKTLSTTPDKVKSGSFVDVLLNATNLNPSTLYYYQVIAKRSSTTTYGNIVQFTTGSPAPEASTGATTSFTSTGATVNGSILANGNTVTPKFCITETYTAGTLSTSNCITGALVTASPSSVTGTSSTSIKYSVTGLTVGKVYYYQAFGVYGGSTVQGTIKSFTFGAPVATTQAATNVKVTSGTTWEAVINGYINSNGFNSENFFRLSDTNTVTSQGQLDSSTVLVASPDSFTARAAISLALTNLAPGATYYFQAIGKNSNGALYSYGEVLSFITASAPDVTTEDVLVFGIDTATVRGTMTANGALTTGTFCISTSNATTAIDGVLDSCLFTLVTSPTTTSGSGTATTGAAVGLMQATTYYYQAIAENARGTAYGVIKSFTTLAGQPAATTVAATNVMGTTATLNGRVNPGGATTTVKFCYGTSSSLSGCTLTDTVTTLTGSAGLTTVLFDVTGLNANTQYYFQVIGTNFQGTVYGAILSFKTGAPTSKTLAATSVTGTSAILNGTIKANGSNITSAKFCLSATNTVGANNDLTCDATNTNPNPNASPASFSASITIDNPESATVTGLTSGNVYYFQIVGINAQGTTYGDVLTFTAGAPIGITKDATNITGSTARLNGSFNTVNDGTATAKMCISDAEDVDGFGALVTCLNSFDIPSGQFTVDNNTYEVYADASGLSAGNTYFFQIQVTGANGSSNGEVLNFSTGFTVQFLANGGSGTMSDQGAVTTTALNANTYTRSGYSFGGWSTVANGSLAYANSANYGFTSDLILYAIWNANPSTPTPSIKLKPKLTWNNPAPIKHGTPLSGNQLNAITDVPSVCVYDPKLGTVLPAGTYTLKVTCTPNDPSYEPISGTVTLIVKGKVRPQIIWFNPLPILYPAPLTGTQLNALANIPGKYQYNPTLGSILNPGKHTLNVKFIPDDEEEYEELEARVTIHVLEKKDDKPTPAPVAPAAPADTQTAQVPATQVILQTGGVQETITVRQNDEKTGIIVSSADWSLAIKSTTQFVQGTTQDTSARVVIEKGNTVTTSGTGFKPNSQVDVWVYSTPTWLGAVMTDEYGNFTTTLPMPDALPEGDHTFQAKGLTPDEKPRAAAIPITLVPATVVNKPGSLRFEVYFAMNSAVVSSKEASRIAKFVKYANGKIAKGAVVTIEVDGWVQPNPHPGNIKYLSKYRADNVAKIMKKLGFKGKYTLKYPGLAKDNIPAARHASVIIKWSKTK